MKTKVMFKDGTANHREGKVIECESWCFNFNKKYFRFTKASCKNDYGKVVVIPVENVLYVEDIEE
jgi:hypothetical protein